MRILVLMIMICIAFPMFGQAQTQKEMQDEMKQSLAEAKSEIADIEKEIAEAKENGEDTETIKEMVNELEKLRKMVSMLEKTMGMAQSPRTVPTTTKIPSTVNINSPIIPVKLEKTVAVPTEDQAKDRLLWYRGKLMGGGNDSMLITTNGMLVLYSQKRNMVIVQPEKTTDPFNKIVQELAKTEQRKKEMVSRMDEMKNSFFFYPDISRAYKDFDSINIVYNKIVKNTIELPPLPAGLTSNTFLQNKNGKGPYWDYEQDYMNSFQIDDERVRNIMEKEYQELLELLNHQPPIDFPPPPQEEFDLCFLCDSNLQKNYKKEAIAWGKKFNEYEVKLISKSFAIEREYQLLGYANGTGDSDLDKKLIEARDLGFKRIDLKVAKLISLYSNDLHRQTLIVQQLLSAERTRQLMGIETEVRLPNVADLIEKMDKDFETYIKDEMNKYNYNVVLNYTLLLSRERQKQLLSEENNPGFNDLIEQVVKFNRFALNMNINFQFVLKDTENNPVMRTTGYISSKNKIYVSLGKNGCKWQLYLTNPDYMADRTNESLFEMPMIVNEGVKLVKKDDKWVTYYYSGPKDMQAVFPSIRLDFCPNGGKDSALMNILRYSDNDLASFKAPIDLSSEYTGDLMEYANLVLLSLSKLTVDRDAVIDVSDEILNMQSFATVDEPTGNAALDKMQVAYKMSRKQLEMKDRIAQASKNSKSVILFDALNEMPTLISKDTDISGQIIDNAEMKQAVVQLRVVHDPL